MTDQPLPSPTRWAHLQPDPLLVGCLDEADLGGRRADALFGPADPKTGWSNRFADACARMVAGELAKQKPIRSLKLTVRPTAAGLGTRATSEPMTVIVGGKTKKVDVAAASEGSGLQIGFSLKGGNFRDREGRQFDKNLTGRSYELSAEMREIHEYQPHAFMTCLYFLPMGATCDKVNGSSFAHMVQYLRAHTGRTDPLSPGQMRLFDMAVIGLYVPADIESYEYGAARKDGPLRFDYEDQFERGVVRYFDVSTDPPRMGRPQVSSTMDLQQMLDTVVARYKGDGTAITWASAEPEREGDPVEAAVDSTPIPDDSEDPTEDPGA